MLVAGCGGEGAANGSPAPAPAPGAAGPATAPPLPVTVIEMQRQSVPVTIESVARTEGSREVEIRARVSGILEQQLYQEGEPIRAGAPMYRIDKAPFEIALEQARAALAQEQARADRARLEAGRLKQLVDERAISRREFDDADSTLRQTQAAVMAAAARVREAELNLSYTSVNAPIAGIAGRALRSQGSLVTANSDSSLLTTLTRTDPIWVRFSLSEPEFAQLRGANERARVQLTLADGRAYERLGRLNFTGSAVDAKLGTVQLRAEFANPNLALLPGQYVKARLEIGRRDAFVVPQTAVLQTDRGRQVWVIGPDDKAALRSVQTAGWVGQDWVVSDGLQPGDRVAIDNLLRLRAGAAVQPQLQRKQSQQPQQPASQQQSQQPASRQQPQQPGPQPPQRSSAPASR
ncbi:MAG: efflux RND transporter periplasmic adaptor subunit [Burkholderiaceae bacterium]